MAALREETSPDQEGMDDNKNKTQAEVIEIKMAAEKNKMAAVKEVDFDDLLPHAGEFGVYQVYLFLCTIPFYFYFATVYYGQMFITEKPSEHWCWISELENLTAVERRSLAIPPDSYGDLGYSRCLTYLANWTEVLHSGIPPDPTTPTVKCRDGWEYNMSDIPYPTISSELNWVCDKDDYQATAQSIFFVGSVVGGFLFGWIGDRYGRIPCAVWANMFSCVAGVGSAYCQNFWQFSLSRFFVGMGYDNCLMMIYILILEYTAPKYRTAMANGSMALFYTVSSCTLPWIALAAAHWRTFTIAISAPLALALLTPLFLPESPRWLLSKGRTEDAIQKLLKIGQVNRRTVPETLLEDFRVAAAKNKEAEQKLTLIDLLRNPTIRRTLILASVMYMLISMIFDGLVRSIGDLGADFFMSFTIASLTEFPSLLLLVFVMDWLGRRWMTSLCCAFTCVFSILAAFVPKGTPTLVCSVVARFATNMSFNAAFQWVAELSPSGGRGAAVGLAHICGCIATIVSPQIVYLQTVRSYLPLLILGLLSGVVSVLALRLAETCGRSLPQSCEDAERLINGQSFWDMPFRKKPKAGNGITNESFEL